MIWRAEMGADGVALSLRRGALFIGWKWLPSFSARESGANALRQRAQCVKPLKRIALLIYVVGSQRHFEVKMIRFDPNLVCRNVEKLLPGSRYFLCCVLLELWNTHSL
jgi:hypothetical protein